MPVDSHNNWLKPVARPRSAAQHGCNAARQIDRLRRCEIAFAVAGKNVERASAFGRDHQIIVAAGGKMPHRHKVRIHRRGRA